MPIYEYKCEECEQITEVLQKFSDQPLVECPKCKGRLKKLISSKVGFDFRGTGFYITDYQKKEEEQKRKKEEKDKGKDTSLTESQSEEKKGKDTTKEEKKESLKK